MPKEIDKYKKTFAKLSKDGDKELSGYVKNESNLNHYRDMYQQGCRLIGEEAQKAKNAGVTGSKYVDFQNEKGVKAAMSSMGEMHQQYKRDFASLTAAIKSAEKTISEVEKLYQTIEGEIKSRKKKQKAGIKSDSLPEMEKMLPTLQKLHDRLKHEVVGQQAIDSPESIWKRTLKNVEHEIGRTKDDRNAKLQAEMDRQGLDLRKANANYKLVMKNAETITKACAAAESEADLKKGKALMKAAGVKLKEIKKLADQYKRALDAVRQGAKDSLATKDGKTLVAIEGGMLKALKNSSELIRDVGSKLKTE